MKLEEQREFYIKAFCEESLCKHCNGTGCVECDPDICICAATSPTECMCGAWYEEDLDDWYDDEDY